MQTSPMPQAMGDGSAGAESCQTKRLKTTDSGKLTRKSRGGRQHQTSSNLTQATINTFFTPKPTKQHLEALDKTVSSCQPAPAPPTSAFFNFTLPTPPTPVPVAGPSNKSLARQVSGRTINNDHALPQPLQLPRESPSRQLYAKLTGIPISTFKIEHGPEFFLFMEMRANGNWIAHKISPRSWIRLTQEYNDALEVKNTSLGLLTIRKNPRALMEKQGEVEKIILGRLAARNFASSSGNTSFWERHCHAVDFGASINENSLKPKTGKPPKFHGESAPPPSNASAVAQVLPWPLPDGIFTKAAKGSHFHPIAFLSHTRTLYRHLVTENTPFEGLDLELQSLFLYFTRRLVNIDGRWLVRIPDGVKIDPNGASLVIKHNDENHILADDISDGTMPEA
ncbi:hypothetical protein NLI96_g12526 [Meripilus lineatus]|uniref:Uncharacterized protein n=1 Tax=Meripilus lineatus TaxID=2056292 RepID=A0AAD5UTQ2_9APHY|nr:hypothetical protein NLI96_g12526 [Physisporinus lineatus]